MSSTGSGKPLSPGSTKKTRKIHDTDQNGLFKRHLYGRGLFRLAGHDRQPAGREPGSRDRLAFTRGGKWSRIKLKCVLNLDIIITDDTVPGTVFMIKRLDGTNVSAVTRLALTTDQDGFKNSIITFHRMREKSIRNKAKRGRIIYKKEVSY